MALPGRLTDGHEQKKGFSLTAGNAEPQFQETLRPFEGVCAQTLGYEA